MSKDNTTLTLKKKTKEQLDNLKLCKDESYGSLLQRILPKWAILLKSKLEEVEKSTTSNSQNDES